MVESKLSVLLRNRRFKVNLVKDVRKIKIEARDMGYRVMVLQVILEEK